jgi:hypothetical protein
MNKIFNKAQHKANEMAVKAKTTLDNASQMRPRVRRHSFGITISDVGSTAARRGLP